MEQPLKARLIGASILVVLAVALVPELLSGPKFSTTGVTPAGGAKGTRTVTIDLGPTVAAGARIEPRPDAQPSSATPPALPPVESPASEPEPQATTDESVAQGAAAPAAATAPPQPAPVATPAATVAPKPEPAATAPAMGGYSVQVGAFGSDATARKLVNELKADGLPAYIAPLSKSGKTLHRVRVGPVADRAAADKLAATLKARKLPVSVVPAG